MIVINNILLNHQVKRNQALLESNLQGIRLRTTKMSNQWDINPIAH